MHFVTPNSAERRHGKKTRLSWVRLSKTRLSWVRLSKNKIVMGALVQKQDYHGRACPESRMHIEIEFVVFTTNCTFGFYHH
jgi:hypothetical protein